MSPPVRRVLELFDSEVACSISGIIIDMFGDWSGWVGRSLLACKKYCIFFNVRLLSVLRGHSGFSQRPMTSDFEGFLYQILFITLLSYLILFLRKSQFQCSVLNKGTTGIIFIMSLVWRDWLVILPAKKWKIPILHYRTKTSCTFFKTVQMHHLYLYTCIYSNSHIKWIKRTMNSIYIVLV